MDIRMMQQEVRFQEVMVTRNVEDKMAIQARREYEENRNRERQENNYVDANELDHRKQAETKMNEASETQSE